MKESIQLQFKHNDYHLQQEEKKEEMRGRSRRLGLGPKEVMECSKSPEGKIVFFYIIMFNPKLLVLFCITEYYYYAPIYTIIIINVKNEDENDRIQ